MFTGTPERAVLETLAYSDVFEHPLRLDELHRFLPLQVRREQVSQVLTLLRDQVGERENFFFLPGREKIVETRRQREACSQEAIPHALRYGRLLGSLPFIRMVALTGSLAMMNSPDNADFDYMLVAVSGRVWTSRAFALLVNRITRWFGHTICPNLIVSETRLEWRQQDLYSARELWQMIPITGPDVYCNLMKANEWTREFLPNMTPPSKIPGTPGGLLQGLLEPPLMGKLGDEVEGWEMKRKIARFSKQEGFGVETVFNTEMCQGNFDHHRKRTEEEFRQRINKLVITPSHPASEGLKVRVE